MVGEYEIEVKDDKGNTSFQKKYGLKAFLPIAKGFPYNDYDDFGSSRSFGYKRQHLGHDMMGQIGTPIIAVESGTVTEAGESASEALIKKDITIMRICVRIIRIRRGWKKEVL